MEFELLTAICIGEGKLEGEKCVHKRSLYIKKYDIE